MTRLLPLLLLACEPALPVQPSVHHGATEPGPHSHQGTRAPQVEPPGPLEIRYLASGGVSLRHGDDLVLTAPMYSNPDLWEVTFGTIESNPDRVLAHLPPEWAEGAAAILVGHAHYDHLIDVPTVWELTGGATVYGNRSMANILGGLTAPGPDFLVALNDPASSLVDTRMCAEPDPCTGEPAGQEGAWIDLPGANARIRALCSSHPSQFLDLVHFGEGCMNVPLDAPPRYANNWKEGATLAFLIDFLDEAGEPAHRIYYQDAPTSSPDGHVHPDLLAEHPVDVALLNVGSYDQVDDHPAAILANLQPRYAMGLHWEDFFTPLEDGVQPIPFHAPPWRFDELVDQNMAPAIEAPVQVDGAPSELRYWRPLPGTLFRFEYAGLE